MSEGVRQLPLPFVHRPDYDDAAFVGAPSNQQARTWLDLTATWPGRRLALWGEAGCGKTHLLLMWARRTGAAVFSGGALPELPPQVPLAIDDADAALGEQKLLLHQLNAAAEDGLPVLLAARTPPARWRAALPDLRSRLRATTAVRIEPAEDELLEVLLRRLLVDRQLPVAPAVQSWLLRRLPRSPAALRKAAARLDEATLARGGAVRRGVATGIVQALEGEVDE